MARLTWASRINLRSCTSPKKNPASISRKAASGAMPGLPLPSQYVSRTSSSSQSSFNIRSDPFENMILGNQSLQAAANEKFLLSFSPSKHVPL